MIKQINTRLAIMTKLQDTEPNYPMACCPGQRSKEGDSILRVKSNSSLPIYLHRECIDHAVELMPMSRSAEDIQREFIGLQEAMRSQGKMFPEAENDVGRCIDV